MYGKDALHETKRACDVWSFAAHAMIQSEGEIYPCDIGTTPHERRIFAYAHASCRRDLRNHSIQSSSQSCQP